MILLKQSSDIVMYCFGTETMLDPTVNIIRKFCCPTVVDLFSAIYIYIYIYKIFCCKSKERIKIF